VAEHLTIEDRFIILANIVGAVVLHMMYVPIGI